MKRITVAASAALLAFPVLAHAKAGVEFERYPDTAKLGEKVDFTVIAIREPPGGGSGRAQPQPIVGRRPLVTFRSKSGRTVRIRATATDRDGIASASVAFPDRGPWTTELRVGDRIELGPERSEPIRVGVGLTQTSPPADAAAPAGGTAFPWLWVLSLASIGSALLVLVMRRRGHWGAA